MKKYLLCGKTRNITNYCIYVWRIKLNKLITIACILLFGSFSVLIPRMVMVKTFSIIDIILVFIIYFCLLIGFIVDVINLKRTVNITFSKKIKIRISIFVFIFIISFVFLIKNSFF